jgi:hypothetical protein
MAEVRRAYASRQVHEALAQRNGPSVNLIRELPIGNEVLIWREGEYLRWEGPYLLPSLIGEDCTVRINDKPVTFRSTSVKPFYRELDQSSSDQTLDSGDHLDPKLPVSPDQADSPNLNGPRPPVVDQTEDPTLEPTSQSPAYQPDTAPEPAPPIKRGRGRPRKQPPPLIAPQLIAHASVINNFFPMDGFVSARKQEINGLLERGVFEFVHSSSVPPSARIYGSSAFFGKSTTPTAAFSFDL